MSEVTITPVWVAPLWARLVSTFFGVGRLGPGPGTWGSAAAVLIWAVVARWTAVQFQWAALVGLSLLAIAVGIASGLAPALRADAATLRRWLHDVQGRR